MAYVVKSEPLVISELDLPLATFTITDANTGAPMADLAEYAPELHLIKPDGEGHTVIPLQVTDTGAGMVVLDIMSAFSVSIALGGLHLEKGARLKGQIFLNPLGDAPRHTVLTEIPIIIRESYRLRNPGA